MAFAVFGFFISGWMGCVDSKSSWHDSASHTDTDQQETEEDTGIESEPDTNIDTGTEENWDTGEEPSSALYEHAEQFILDGIDFLITVEAPNESVSISLSGEEPESIEIRNAMRNTISWTQTDLQHQLCSDENDNCAENLTNKGMCMNAFVLKEVYPYVSVEKQDLIQTNLYYLQNAVLASQNKTESEMSYGAIPAKPNAKQWSAKTNAICGLSLIHLHYFWEQQGQTEEQENAKQAAKDIALFLKGLQQPTALPTIPSSLTILSHTDADGVFSGVFEEVIESNGRQRLVLSTSLWSAMAGRFFTKLASLNWFSPTESADLQMRAESIYSFYAVGLSQGREYFSPQFTCFNHEGCQYRLIREGYSVARVENWSTGTATAQGGDDLWHARFLAPSKGLFENLNGTDGPQWALNALHAISPSEPEDAHFGKYFSQETDQLHRVGSTYWRFPLEDRRNIFLGLGTYIAHGTANQDGTFSLSAVGTDIAHYIAKETSVQIVTSNYGDSAVSNWGNTEWKVANERLLTPEDLLHTTDSPTCGAEGSDPAWVCLSGKYDFGNLSHLAHWAMVEEEVDGSRLALRAKYTNQKLTLSPENLASTICRVLRVWKGIEACTL